jgi:hypothetical protein
MKEESVTITLVRYDAIRDRALKQAADLEATHVKLADANKRAAAADVRAGKHLEKIVALQIQLSAASQMATEASGVDGPEAPWVSFVFGNGHQVKFTGPDREAMAKEYRQFRKDLTFVRAQQPEKETP